MLEQNVSFAQELGVTVLIFTRMSPGIRKKNYMCNYYSSIYKYIIKMYNYILNMIKL